ncbi:LuxR C-terminal-related transcriptional regulator [Deinococcus malanensis]|uniref:LuxR C-terminal-related transcriptional regulator n=1 Tax=Deinococcus malanensis TaxID=1706855 RepID=UPI003644D109
MGGAGQARWHLLEPIREFAAKLLDVNADHVLRDRQARYFLALADSAERDLELLTPEWQARLRAEEANIHAALAWFILHEQAPEALKMVLALAPYWEGATQHQVELKWATAALALPASHQEPRLRAAVLCSRAYCEQDLYQLDTVLDTLTEALALYRSLQDEPGETKALRILASAQSALGKVEQALSLFGQLEARFAASGDAYLLCETLHNTAATYIGIGQSARAIPYLERALPLARQTNYRNGEAFILMLHVWAGFLRGQATPGRPHQRSLERGRAARIPGLSARLLLVLASYAREGRRQAFAAQLFSLAEGMHEALGKPWPRPFELEARRLDTELSAGLGRQYEVERDAGAHRTMNDFQPEINAWLDGKSTMQVADQQGAAPQAELTAREQEVLRYLAQGASDKRIAQVLSISVGTASKHVANMLGKLGLRNRVELARWASQHGMDGGASLGTPPTS